VGSAVDGEAATGRRWRERGGRGGRGRAHEEKVGRVLTLSFLLITGNATYRASVCPDALLSLHTSPINLRSTSALFYWYPRLSLSLRRLDKERRGRRETCSALLRTSIVTPPAPASSAAPLLLLYGPLRLNGRPALLLPLLHCAAQLLLLCGPLRLKAWMLTSGDRSLGR
jgi:hypothetical protein